jgi:flagellar biosynthetic protein FliP
MMRRVLTRGLAVAGLLVCALMVGGPALAAPGDPPAVPTGTAGPTDVGTTGAGTNAAPSAPTGPTGPTGQSSSGAGTDQNPGSVLINVDSRPSNSITIIIALTVLSVAPAVLLLCTSFTKIFVVLSITRNALGLTSVPPNQVIAGLALFLSLFVMGPVVSEVNRQGVAPFLAGTQNAATAFHNGSKPLQAFMLAHTRKEELALMANVADPTHPPKNRDELPLTTLIPAFILSELRAALIIGFAVYVPFLVIDMVVSASLMSMGMMMLPPVTVSLPFKLLLFVLADGWGLVVTSLVASYR